MAQTWPPSLPDYFLGEGYSESPKDSVIRTANDIGLESLRNRYTTTITEINGSMHLTQVQVDTLNDFYANTLNAVLTFDMINPITSAVRELRFRAPPQFSSLAGEYYTVVMSLETV